MQAVILQTEVNAKKAGQQKCLHRLVYDTCVSLLCIIRTERKESCLHCCVLNLLTTAYMTVLMNQFSAFLSLLPARSGMTWLYTRSARPYARVIVRSPQAVAVV